MGIHRFTELYSLPYGPPKSAQFIYLDTSITNIVDLFCVKVTHSYQLNPHVLTLDLLVSRKMMQ